MKRKIVIIMRVICIIFAIIGIVLIGIGFDKIKSYENPDSEYEYLYDEEDYVNSYVGGDAYNYIINGTYFTAYAVMGTGAFLISAIIGVASVFINISSINLSEKEKLPEL